jgi:hypothetical protein
MSDYKNFLQGRGFNSQETEHIKTYSDRNDGTCSTYKSGSHPEYKIIFKTGETKRLYITKTGNEQYDVKNNFGEPRTIKGFNNLSTFMDKEL